MITGRTLPLAPEQVKALVPMVSAATSEGMTADQVYMPTTTGRFVQVTSAATDSRLRESYFWVADNGGVRFGLDTSDQQSGDVTLTALKLHYPVPAPWVVVSLFAAGAHAVAEGCAHPSRRCSAQPPHCRRPGRQRSELVRTSFNRPFTPVAPPRISRDEINVPAPKEIEEGEPVSKLRTIGVPLLMVVVLAGMVAMMMRTGRFNPMFLMFPLIMLMGMGTMMFGQSGGGGTSRAQLLSDRKAQTRGLGVTREKVFDRGLSMHEGLQHAFPRSGDAAQPHWDRTHVGSDAHQRRIHRAALRARRGGAGCTDRRP